MFYSRFLSGPCLTQGQGHCCDEVDWHRSLGRVWHVDRVSAVMRWTDTGLLAMSDTRTGSVLWWGGLLVVLWGGGGFLSRVQSQVDEGENGFFQSQVLQAVHHTCKTNQSVSPVQIGRKHPFQKKIAKNILWSAKPSDPWVCPAREKNSPFYKKRNEQKQNLLKCYIYKCTMANTCAIWLILAYGKLYIPPVQRPLYTPLANYAVHTTSAVATVHHLPTMLYIPPVQWPLYTPLANCAVHTTSAVATVHTTCQLCCTYHQCSGHCTHHLPTMLYIPPVQWPLYTPLANYAVHTTSAVATVHTTCQLSSPSCSTRATHTKKTPNS